jgi:hypothetical protein
MDTINVIGSIATALGVAFGVLVYRRQMNAQLFLDYTKRFDELMRANDGSNDDFGTVMESRQPGATGPGHATLLRRYLNLCSEEFYLWRRGYLSTGIWAIWEREIVRTLRKPGLREWWKAERNQFASFKEFAEYVDAAQQDPAGPARIPTVPRGAWIWLRRQVHRAPAGVDA